MFRRETIHSSRPGPLDGVGIQHVAAGGCSTVRWNRRALRLETPAGQLFDLSAHVETLQRPGRAAAPGPIPLPAQELAVAGRAGLQAVVKSLARLGCLPQSADNSAKAWLHGKLPVALPIEKIIHDAAAISPWGPTWRGSRTHGAWRDFQFALNQARNRLPRCNGSVVVRSVLIRANDAAEVVACRLVCLTVLACDVVHLPQRASWRGEWLALAARRGAVATPGGGGRATGGGPDGLRGRGATRGGGQPAERALGGFVLMNNAG